MELRAFNVKYDAVSV